MSKELINQSISIIHSSRFSRPSRNASVDLCHGMLILSNALSSKPEKILEIGIGPGFCSEILLSAIEYNGKGKLTCVDNFVDLISKLNKTQKFIYASSSSVYGVVDSPVDENHLCFKTYENYDTQKIIIDLIANQMDLNYYGLRFGTVNGYSPHTREDIMLNAMTKSAWEKNEVNIFNPKTKRPILK